MPYGSTDPEASWYFLHSFGRLDSQFPFGLPPNEGLPLLFSEGGVVGQPLAGLLCREKGRRPPPSGLYQTLLETRS